MTHTDTLPDNAIDIIAPLIGERLNPLIRKDFLPPPGGALPEAEIKETLSIWTFKCSVYSLKLDSGSFGNYVKPLNHWHHQISIDDSDISFAETRPPNDDKSSDWSVLRVSSNSQVSRAISKATDWVDRNVLGDPVVRLLLIPEFHMHTFWLNENSRNNILLVKSPEQYLDYLKYGTLYSSQEFIKILRKLPSAQGPTGQPPML